MLLQQTRRTVSRDGWTGTQGRVDSPLPYDWTEAEMELKEKSYDSDKSGVIYTPRFVRDTFEWAQTVFGDQAKFMTVVEIAEYWFEFA
ncbi:MAG: hypothetical protein EXS48_02345 [Candidatus Staskawiczbacteria bacterium]|nr:hypothetical protein [Candidatus Staskawiczbacteria bacterium]